MKERALRMERVDAPIIPTIAALTRQTPGTISLGQGVVSYGPPPEAIGRLPALLADAQLHKYQPVSGYAPVLGPTRADWSLDVDALAAAITPRTRAIVTVSPNNPTGAVYTEADLRSVNALCARAGIYHFSDEAYEYFTFEGARHFSPGSIPGAHAHTLSFYSLSKNFGMASWRVGYVVFPSELAAAMDKV